MTETWSTVPRLLEQNTYLVLGTADAAGKPWVSPIFFSAPSEHQLLWVSSPDSRHSRNIASRPEVAITIFDSHAPIGRAEALYLTATATLVADRDHRAAMATFNTRLPASHHVSLGDLASPGPLRLYQADVTHHDILIRGGDPRFDNDVDARLRVHRPDPGRAT